MGRCGRSTSGREPWMLAHFHFAPTTGDSHVTRSRFAGHCTQSCIACFCRSGGGIFSRRHDIETCRGAGGAVAVAAARAETASALLRSPQLPDAAPAGSLNRRRSGQVLRCECSHPVMLNHLSYQPQETVMLRTFVVLAITLGLAAMESATPASASSSQVFRAHKELILAHLHPVTSPGKTMYRPPSKKRP